MTPLYPQKLALTSPTGGSRSVGIVRLRTKAIELLFTIGNKKKKRRKKKKKKKKKKKEEEGGCEKI